MKITDTSVRLATNLTTLRQYLHIRFYPSIFNRPADADDDDDSWMFSPVERAVDLHKEFVIFLGERQADWYDEYVKELRYLFRECGETDEVVALTLREPGVMHYMRPFCFAPDVTYQ